MKLVCRGLLRPPAEGGGGGGALGRCVWQTNTVKTLSLNSYITVKRLLSLQGWGILTVSGFCLGVFSCWRPKTGLLTGWLFWVGSLVEWWLEIAKLITANIAFCDCKLVCVCVCMRLVVWFLSPSHAWSALSTLQQKNAGTNHNDQTQKGESYCDGYHTPWKK